jgi:hypothetical protein
MKTVWNAENRQCQDRLRRLKADVHALWSTGAPQRLAHLGDCRVRL